MTINTVNNKRFELLDVNKTAAGSLIYTTGAFDDAVIETAENFLLNGIATGLWITHGAADGGGKIISKIRVETGGLISVRLLQKKKKYHFKKSGGWKLRFSLVNKEGDDILSIIPSVNWQKQSHDFVLQINEDFEKECDAFLILQTIHCANCSLSMMTGGSVPALISV